MKRKLRLRVLIGVFVIAAVAIGVLVWPEPEEARATHTQLFVHLETPGLNEEWYDIDAKVQMLDIQGFSIPDGWIVDLIPDPMNGQIWEATLYNIPDVAVQFKVYWYTNSAAGYDWGDESDGEVIDFIDWNSEEILLNIPVEYEP